jgi:hypothetical protein
MREIGMQVHSGIGAVASSVRRDTGRNFSLFYPDPLQFLYKIIILYSRRRGQGVMENPQDELLAIADREGTLSTSCDDPSVKDPIDAMENAAKRIGKAWSGSWLGYQSHVYYDGLKPAPAGAHFSSEWGFENMGWLDGATTGDWEELSAEQIETSISEPSHNPDFDLARELVARVAKQFENDKSEVASPSEYGAFPFSRSVPGVPEGGAGQAALSFKGWGSK